MPQIKVTTKTRMTGKWSDPEGPVTTVIMIIDLLPKGGGNRNFARRLGRAFKQHDLWAKHVKKVVVGTSRVTVHIIPSLAAMEATFEARRRLESRARDFDPDQLPLPFSV